MPESSADAVTAAAAVTGCVAFPVQPAVASVLARCIEAVSGRSMPSRAVAGGMDRKAEEETMVELSATTATPRDARPAGAQQAGDLRDMA